jgi:hypothetical protein
LVNHHLGHKGVSENDGMVSGHPNLGRFVGKKKEPLDRISFPRWSLKLTSKCWFVKLLIHSRYMHAYIYIIISIYMYINI